MTSTTNQRTDIAQRTAHVRHPTSVSLPLLILEYGLHAEPVRGPRRAHDTRHTTRPRGLRKGEPKPFQSPILRAALQRRSYRVSLVTLAPAPANATQPGNAGRCKRLGGRRGMYMSFPVCGLWDRDCRNTRACGVPTHARYTARTWGRGARWGLSPPREQYSAPCERPGGGCCPSLRSAGHPASPGGVHSAGRLPFSVFRFQRAGRRVMGS